MDSPAQLLAALGALRVENDELQAEARSVQAEIMQLIGIAPTGPITAVLDDAGMLVELRVDPAADELEAEDLQREVNAAVFRAAGPLTGFGDVRGGAATDRLTAAAEAEPAPVTTTNSTRTVSVTTLLGTLNSIDLDLDWVDETSVAGVAAEIVRVAQQAARADDPTNRFDEES